MYCMYCMWVTWDKLEGKTGETLAWDSSYPGLKGSCKRNGASGHTGRCGRSAYVHPEWRILATVATGMGERYKKCGFYHLREVSILSSFPTLPLGCPVVSWMCFTHACFVGVSLFRGSRLRAKEPCEPSIPSPFYLPGPASRNKLRSFQHAPPYHRRITVEDWVRFYSNNGASCNSSP